MYFPIEAFIDRNRNEHQEAYERLSNSVPQGANAILGVKTSTAIQVFTEGTYLYITYKGTPEVNNEQ